ncbi:MAG: efflux RND transporter periplasmic adaptor subunit [Bacteroidales bacterium]|nr:efflux RND transporter periplasmic adaptor subunit [Bacteroidales bacterium]
MKHIRTIFLVSLSAGILLASCNQPDTEVTTTIEVPVGVIEVSTASIEEFVSTTGSVYPLKEVILSSEITGNYVLQTNPATRNPYALGDRVKANATIVKLEDEEYYNDLRIRSKEVDLEISKLEFDKQRSLYDKGGATLRELKNAEINLINTEYDIESNQLALAKMTLKAPFSGVIADLPYFTNGTRVNSNTMMIKVIDYGKLYMEANLPEKYFKSIARGYKVYITSYTSTSDTLMGLITQISPSIDPEARTFKCFVEVDNSNTILLPGMFVKADLVVNSSDNTLVIPKDIIVSRNRNQIVYVVDKGVARERVITTGLENENSIEVKMGLLKGESVVSSGFETLRDQSRVRILR